MRMMSHHALLGLREGPVREAPSQSDSSPKVKPETWWLADLTLQLTFLFTYLLDPTVNISKVHGLQNIICSQK